MIILTGFLDFRRVFALNERDCKIHSYRVSTLRKEYVRKMLSQSGT